MIEFKCSQCREDMDAPESLVGQTEKCPNCGLINRVPSNQEGRAGRDFEAYRCPGFLYVLINASMPDVVKVGKTERDPESPGCGHPAELPGPVCRAWGRCQLLEIAIGVHRHHMDAVFTRDPQAIRLAHIVAAVGQMAFRGQQFAVAVATSVRAT